MKGFVYVGHPVVMEVHRWIVTAIHIYFCILYGYTERTDGQYLPVNGKNHLEYLDVDVRIIL